ncbi:MAG: aminotransferase class V-fold PLP-dependent enzyme, partial [Planctomycetales bacterium]|nr:aminotransferase class V-fold PLP-dependent enzyme [Planctomycetales bacterium]
MVQTPVYMDNHATTRVDPRVVDAMLPLFHEQYGNAGSTSHVFGWDAKEAVDRARESIAQAIGASSREIVFTSGATESNNLAIRGCADRTRRRGNHIISVATEHKAVLDPLAMLARRGFEITLLPVRQMGDPIAGQLDVQRVADAIRDDTLLVTVMLANNEIGVIQPLAEIGEICKQRGVLLHTDATQAVGKIPVDVEQMQVDLLSFSAHKLYGPKGVGGLYVRRRGPQVRLTPQIDGGGQEGGRRSGTLNVPGIVGFAKALGLCVDEMGAESNRLSGLRDRLFNGLANAIEHVTLNGPELSQRAFRLAG